MESMHDDFSLLREFPLLKETGFRVTSSPDRRYNCIAWAADETSKWWWPDDAGYWPEEVPREATLEAFVAAYATRSYVPCDNDEPEEGYEKVAIYANQKGPQHAARQLPNGKWTSKLGALDDIEHNTLDGVNCECYGSVVKFLRRPRRIWPSASGNSP